MILDFIDGIKIHLEQEIAPEPVNIVTLNLLIKIDWFGIFISICNVHSAVVPVSIVVFDINVFIVSWWVSWLMLVVVQCEGVGILECELLFLLEKRACQRGSLVALSRGRRWCILQLWWKARLWQAGFWRWVLWVPDSVGKQIQKVCLGSRIELVYHWFTLLITTCNAFR